MRLVYNTIFDNSPQIKLLIDCKNYKVISANKAARKIFKLLKSGTTENYLTDLLLLNKSADLPRHPVAGRHVLLVDDIVDSGRTLAFAQAWLRERGVASLRTATLLDKPSRRVVPVPVEHVGFEIEDVFVVGYGTDHAERHRELPYIGVKG